MKNVDNPTRSTDYRYMKKAIVILFLAMSLTGCNVVAKKLGGSMTVELEKDQKLVNCCWKAGGSLWVLTRQRREGEPLETYKYQEKSTLGLLEGTVTIVEK